MRATVAPASATATMGKAGVTAAVGVSTGRAAAPIAVPRFVDVDYIEGGAIARISKFRSGIGHAYVDDFETCRSMKHYFQPREGVDAASIPIASPVSGTIVEVRPEWAGTQVAIRSEAYPDYTLVIFHVAPARPLAAGDRVAAGERLGTHIGAQTMSDIAVRWATPEGMRLVSYFDVMTDRLFATYQARGLGERANAVLSRAERDRRPLRCDGERFVDGEAAGDWVELGGVARSQALQADGKLVVAGTYADAATQNQDFTLLRFGADGSLAGSFGRMTRPPTSRWSATIPELQVTEAAVWVVDAAGGGMYTAGHAPKLPILAGRVQPGGNLARTEPGLPAPPFHPAADSPGRRRPGDHGLPRAAHGAGRLRRRGGRRRRRRALACARASAGLGGVGRDHPRPRRPRGLPAPARGR